MTSNKTIAIVMTLFSLGVVISLLGGMQLERTFIKNNDDSQFYSAGSNLGTMRTILTKEGHCAWGTYGNGDPKNCITAGQYLDWCISLWTENNTGDPLSWCSNLMIKGNNGTSYASQPIQKLPVIGLMVFQQHYVLLSDNICRGKGVMINQTGEISCQDNHEILGVMPWIK